MNTPSLQQGGLRELFFGKGFFGNITLGLFILSIPILYMNAREEWAWVAQPLGLLAVAANLPDLRPRIHSSMLSLGAIWLYFALTAFDSEQQYVSEYFLVFGKFVALAMILSMEVRTRRQLITIMGSLAVSAVIVALLSRHQLSESRHLLDEVASARLGAARTAGIFSNSNLFGTYAVLSALAALILALCTNRLVAMTVSLPSLLCAAYLVYFSGSRQAIVGMVLLCGFALWQALILTKARTGRIMSVIIAITVLGGGIIWWQTNPFITRFNTNEESYRVRNDLFRGAVAMWQKAPLFGSGYRAFELKDISGDYTHSTPMEMLVSGGVVALGLYLALFGATFQTVRKCLKREQSPRERIILLGLGCFWGTLFMFSLFTVIIEEKIFLALCGGLCGFLHQKDLELAHRVNPSGEYSHAHPL